MKRPLTAFFALAAIVIVMKAQKQNDDASFHYKYQQVKGSYMAAYRSAAIDFFKKRSIDECSASEKQYEIQFTGTTSSPGVVTITFLAVGAGNKAEYAVGGGQTNYDVDTATGKIIRIYGSR